MGAMAKPTPTPDHRDLFLRALLGDSVDTLTKAQRKDVRDALHVLDARSHVAETIAICERMQAAGKGTRVDEISATMLDGARTVLARLKGELDRTGLAATAFATLPPGTAAKELRRLVREAREALRGAAPAPKEEPNKAPRKAPEKAKPGVK